MIELTQECLLALLSGTAALAAVFAIVAPLWRKREHATRKFAPSAGPWTSTRSHSTGLSVPLRPETAASPMFPDARRCSALQWSDDPEYWSTLAESNFAKSEGDMVPDVPFLMRVRDAEAMAAGEENPFTWQTISSHADVFKGKRVALFALPGAYTPTCSSTHVPGYLKNYDSMKAAGIDEVYCLSVNDAFVMRQWGLQQGCVDDGVTGAFTKVKFLPDGAALFTRGMGASSTWTSNRGFGERSWRYSMVVDDGKIEKMFIEPGFSEDSGPDPFIRSDADTMLAYLTQK